MLVLDKNNMVVGEDVCQISSPKKAQIIVNQPHFEKNFRGDFNNNFLLIAASTRTVTAINKKLSTKMAKLKNG